MVVTTNVSSAQSGYNPILGLRTVYIKNDTITEFFVRPIAIFSRRVDARRYDRLVRNLKIVYPIAKYANRTMRQMEAQLLTIKSKRDQQRFIKEMEAELKRQFTPILRRMSISQGKLLIKLIDRETGNTSYSLLKEFRGGFQAFCWQGIARIFGSNLKDEYDGNGEDRAIEDLIIMLEAGML